MCGCVCVCQALDVNGLGSFECQQFVRITSNLSGDVFEGVDRWGLQDCHELIKLSMRTTLERGHSSDIVRTHTHTQMFGIPVTPWCYARRLSFPL